jgi:2-oxoglutarate ferredoxin oxidoreductase subunit alpha
VIYSQSEVNLACFGGNGNGYRIVYSPATLQELYDYGIKVFNIAWKYRFPTFLLGDGYLAKMMGEVEVYSPEERGIKMEPTEAYMLAKDRKVPLESVVPSPELHIRKGADGTSYDCFRNCLNLEEETLAVNMEIKAAWDKMAPVIEEHAEYGASDSEILIVAHGIVAAAARSAIDALAKQGVKARLFRPITLRPFPEAALRKAAQGAKKILIPESALGQLSRFVRDTLYGHAAAPIVEYGRPSIGITPSEIERLVREHSKEHA